MGSSRRTIDPGKPASQPGRNRLAQGFNRRHFLCDAPYMDIIVSRRAINQALQRKRSAWIFHPLEEARLSLSELVVYSFRSCQNEFQRQAPSRRQVARAVGMGRDAVARADRELRHVGLLDCNFIPQEPPEGWFQKKRKIDPGRHWRHGYTSWMKYVLKPNCRMAPLRPAGTRPLPRARRRRRTGIGEEHPLRDPPDGRRSAQARSPVRPATGREGSCGRRQAVPRARLRQRVLYPPVVLRRALPGLDRRRPQGATSSIRTGSSTSWTCGTLSC